MILSASHTIRMSPPGLLLIMGVTSLPFIMLSETSQTWPGVRLLNIDCHHLTFCLCQQCWKDLLLVRISGLKGHTTATPGRRTARRLSPLV